MVDFDLIDKKKALGKQRIAKFSSSIKKAVLEIINTEFIMTNRSINFSVADVTTSKDLRYCDVHVIFFDSSEKESDEIIEKLNKSGTHQGYKCGFLPLKLAISKKILSRIRLKYVPDVRFRKVSNDYLMINNIISNSVQDEVQE